MAPGAPVPPRSRQTRAVAVPAPVAPESLRPAVLEPAEQHATLLDESGAPYTPPDRSEEEKVATWLTTYLVATGHATGDEPALAEREEPAIDPVDPATDARVGRPGGPGHRC